MIVKGKWGRIRTETDFSYFKYDSVISMEGVRKTTETSVNITCFRVKYRSLDFLNILLSRNANRLTATSSEFPVGALRCNRPTDVHTLGGFYCRRVVSFHCELFLDVYRCCRLIKGGCKVFGRGWAPAE
jgi:hypothetical protein